MLGGDDLYQIDIDFRRLFQMRSTGCVFAYALTGDGGPRFCGVIGELIREFF
jgi:hypothetical protein